MKFFRIIWLVSTVSAQLVPPLYNIETVWLEYTAMFPNVQNLIDFDQFLALPIAKQQVLNARIRIDEHNEKYDEGIYTYKLGPQDFDWMTPDQFEEHKCGGRTVTPQSRKKRSVPQGTTSCTNTNVPAAVDWRNSFGPIQNQLTCGDCFVFAGVSILEALTSLAYGSVIKKLSEEQVLQCTVDGCRGGSSIEVFNASRDNGGLVLASNYYAYDGVDTYGCNQAYSRQARSTVAYYSFLPRYDEISMRCAVAKGPIIIALYGDAPEFKNYIGPGIYSDQNAECGTHPANHIIVLVGYGTDSNNNPYWIVRNSWGTNWGVNGYGFIARGSNVCQIGREPLYPTLTTFCSSIAHLYSGNTYLKSACISANYGTQATAYQQCAKYNMALFEISSALNQNQLFSLLTAQGYAGYTLWIDGEKLSDANGNANWYFVSYGTTPAYASLPWYSSAASATGCLAAANYNSNWYVDGLNCGTQLYYVCEYNKNA